MPRLNARQPQRCEHDDGSLLLTSLHAFYSYLPAPEEERLYPSALQLFQSLSQAREHRLNVSRLRLPDALRWFVYFGGFICVGTLWLPWVDSLAVHLLLVGGMTWIVVGATSIIIDLDDPFRGDFVVDWKRFDEAAAMMAPPTSP